MRMSRREGRALAAAVLALTAWGAGRADADLVLTQKAIDQGFQLTTFATGFPNQSSIGPLGIGFQSGGGVLVSDYLGNVRVFPTGADGQVAGSAPITQNYGVTNAFGITQVGNNYYMAQQANGSVVQINADGTLRGTVVSGLKQATGILGDPSSGLLFVSTTPGPVYKVDPTQQTASLFSTMHLDGLTLTSDGKTLFGAVDDSTLAGHIVGLDTTTGQLTKDLGFVPGGVDGAALGTGILSGNLFVNTNAGTLVDINLLTGAQTLLATGGSRGDFVLPAPDGTLLLTQTDSIKRLIPPPQGGFGNPGPDAPTVPEPSTLALLGLGTAALAVWRRRRGGG
jgi:hypothetical protein